MSAAQLLRLAREVDALAAELRRVEETLPRRGWAGTYLGKARMCCLSARHSIDRAIECGVDPVIDAHASSGGTK